MGDLFLLSEAQMARISPYFLLSHGVPRVDDRRYQTRPAMKSAPGEYGPPKTLYNRFIRWSRVGVFDRIFAALAGEGPKPERIMIRLHPSEGASDGGEPPKKGLFPAASAARKAG